MVTADAKSDQEIKGRIGIAKTTYKMACVLQSKSVTMSTRLRLLKCYVWSTLLYCCEGWIISKTMESRLLVTEMWFLSRMLKISWKDKVPNEEVLRRVNTSRQLMLTIVTRQIRFVGHVARKEKLKYLTLTGKVEGKRARGCQRLTFLSWLERSTGYKPLNLIRMMRRRKENDAMTAVYARTLP